MIPSYVETEDQSDEDVDDLIYQKEDWLISQR